MPRNRDLKALGSLRTPARHLGSSLLLGLVCFFGVLFRALHLIKNSPSVKIIPRNGATLMFVMRVSIVA